MQNIFHHQYFKYFLQALAITCFGYVLLNITFLFDYIVQMIVLGFIHIFTKQDLMMTSYWFPWLLHILFLIIIAIISWFVFRSKLNLIYKAIYLTVPTAVVSVTIGILFCRSPVISYLLCAILVLATLYYFYRKNLSWLYYYAVILVAVALAIFSMLGGEI